MRVNFSLPVLAVVLFCAVPATSCRKDGAKGYDPWKDWLENAVKQNPRLASGDKVVFLSVPVASEGGMTEEKLAVRELRKGFGGQAIAFDVKDAARPSHLLTFRSPESALFEDKSDENKTSCVLMFRPVAGSRDPATGPLPSSCQETIEMGEWRAARCPCDEFGTLIRAVQ